MLARFAELHDFVSRWLISTFRLRRLAVRYAKARMRSLKK